jgi:hypothetical protein
MRVNWHVRAAALLLTLVGCAGFPLFSRAAADHPVEAAGSVSTINGDFTQAKMELQNISFDGETLHGRLLVSPVSAKLRIDKRLNESFDLSVDSVVECDTGAGLAYVIMDVFAPPLREEDILTLAPGFWYGKEVRLFLFAVHATKQPLPQCFEAEIVYHALNVKNAARLHVRVERNLPASSATDAGVPTPSEAEGGVGFRER